MKDKEAREDIERLFDEVRALTNRLNDQYYIAGERCHRGTESTATEADQKADGILKHLGLEARSEPSQPPRIIVEKKKRGKK